MTDLTVDSVPDWARGVRTRLDEARDRWIIVGPERILVPEGPGADIARLVDGSRSVDDIVARLTSEYDAAQKRIAAETIEFLQNLVDQGYLEP